jgi:acyl carrier protein
MSRDTIIQELEPIFRDVLDQPDLTLQSKTSASSVDGWDSLAHVNLVVAIEKRYRVKFALGELQSLKNVGDMADLIEKKVSKS